jgi:predicted DNA binding CopG/RHH family protein
MAGSTQLPPKGKSILVKVSDSELAAFRKLAVRQETNLSQLIRRLLHREVAVSNKKTAREKD